MARKRTQEERRTEMVRELVDAIGKNLAGKGAALQGNALCNCVVMWLCGFRPPSRRTEMLSHLLIGVQRGMHHYSQLEAMEAKAEEMLGVDEDDKVVH